MKKTIAISAILFIVSLVYAFDNVQTRYAGVANDIKYVGRHNSDYLFVVCTDDGRIYQILSDDVPYFGIGDTIMKYWFDFNFKGIGVKSSIYYYMVIK